MKVFFLEIAHSKEDKAVKSRTYGNELYIEEGTTKDETGKYDNPGEDVKTADSLSAYIFSWMQITISLPDEALSLPNPKGQ